jgi:hypothetical protein
MAFLEWLEASNLAEWARVSLEGYPIIITAHSIGLAIMVGAALMLDFRLLGWIKDIPFTFFSRILGFAWIGFAINFLSGLVLFSMEATSYVSNTLFLIKITLVLLGVATAAQQQFVISRDAASWDSIGIPTSVTVIAIFSLVFWSGSIVAGRLIAYLD